MLDTFLILKMYYVHFLINNSVDTTVDELVNLQGKVNLK